MWVYCPKCQQQKNLKDYSLYYIYKCNGCNHKFRGIHAKMNLAWHTVIRVLTPKWDRPDTTCCIHCGNNVRGSDNGWWPKVCGSCSHNLPTEPADQNAKALF